MKLIYKLLTSACLMCYGFVQAQTVTKNIQHVKQYVATEKTSVELENKYGNIDVTNWDKDSIKIIIDISLTAKKKEKLQRLINYTNIDFTDTKDFVAAKTRLGTSKVTHAISVSFDESFGASDITINYAVFLPSGSELEIVNGFGDVFLHSRTGKTNVDISHGNVRANQLSDDFTLKAAYGKVKIKKAKDVEMELKHCSDIEVKKVDNLKLKSSYSSLEIGEVDKLRLDSRKDKIEIDKINVLYGSCSLPNIYVEELKSTIDLKSKMVGNIEVSEVSTSFVSVEISTSYSSVKLNFL